MIYSNIVSSLSDNGGRRSGIEWRRFSYNCHISERWCGEDRRSGEERAVAIEMRSGKDRTSGMELKSSFA